MAEGREHHVRRDVPQHFLRVVVQEREFGYPRPATCASTTANSSFVCSTISAVHATQKIGRVVKPLFNFGIWKQVCPVAIRTEQRSHFVAFPQVCTTGAPVDMDRRDGVLPFGFATEQPLVLAR